MTRRTFDDIAIDDPNYVASGRLSGKVAVVTGGDSGIGAAVSIMFAKEGALVVVNYLNETEDAQDVVDKITSFGGSAVTARGDLRRKTDCKQVIERAILSYGRLDILVNNAGTQVEQKNLRDISKNQLVNTFRTNVYSMFFLTQVALQYMTSGASIINTSSVTAYRGSPHLIDYAATKGAIVSFTRSLSSNLASMKIRVNAVAPGPVWTPLVLTSFPESKLEEFGKDQPLGYAAQPIEIAPAYVYLASDESRYVTGQVLHVNGGEVVNG